MMTRELLVLVFSLPVVLLALALSLTIDRAQVQHRGKVALELADHVSLRRRLRARARTGGKSVAVVRAKTMRYGWVWIVATPGNRRPGLPPSEWAEERRGWALTRRRARAAAANSYVRRGDERGGITDDLLMLGFALVGLYLAMRVLQGVEWDTALNEVWLWVTGKVREFL